jgi:hypothetical protein
MPRPRKYAGNIAQRKRTAFLKWQKKKHPEYKLGSESSRWGTGSTKGMHWKQDLTPRETAETCQYRLETIGFIDKSDVLQIRKELGI